jgi:AcrR family transcriptional regulator
VSAASTPEAAGGTPSRRQELLRLAGELFASRGFTNTTVRDIADAAGILSGSLYHHFDSKESMVDELLSSFQEELFGTWEAILKSDRDPRSKVEAVVRASFDALDKHHSEVAIYQNDASFLMESERFAYLKQRNDQFREVWLTILREGMDAGALRQDLDVELVYRFVRDTVWVAVRWYRPGGAMSIETVADQYLSILLEGIAHA